MILVDFWHFPRKHVPFVYLACLWSYSATFFECINWYAPILCSEVDRGTLKLRLARGEGSMPVRVWIKLVLHWSDKLFCRPLQRRATACCIMITMHPIDKGCSHFRGVHRRMERVTSRAEGHIFGLQWLEQLTLSHHFALPFEAKRSLSHWNLK